MPCQLSALALPDALPIWDAWGAWGERDECDGQCGCHEEITGGGRGVSGTLAGIALPPIGSAIPASVPETPLPPPVISSWQPHCPSHSSRSPQAPQASQIGRASGRARAESWQGIESITTNNNNY